VREKLCRKYWENVIERMKEAINFFDTKEQGHNYQLAFDYIEHCSKIKEELSKNMNIKTCCDNDCPHYLPIKDTRPNSPSPTSTGSQISQTDKNQIRQYLIKYSISKISLVNGKLVIEYNNNSKKTVENEDQEQQKYHQLIENLPNKSLSLSELQNNNNSVTPNKSKTGIYISLIIGAFVLGGIFVYFLTRKRKNK